MGQPALREIDELVQAGNVIEIPWQRIRPNPHNPRTYFNPVKLAQLSGSIAECGQKTPVTVRPVVGDPEHDFELIAGERRLRVCTSLDIPVRAIVNDIQDPDERLEEAVLENCNRDDLTYLETARVLARMRETKQIQRLKKGEQIPALARKFGHSEQWVYHYLGLLRLVPELRRRLEPTTSKKDRLPFSLAVKLSSFDRNDQLLMYKRIKKGSLSFARASRLIGEEINRRGLGDHRRGRKPSDTLKVFDSFLHRAISDAERILEMPDKEFKPMLASRNEVQRTGMVTQLNLALETLAKIRQRLL